MIGTLSRFSLFTLLAALSSLEIECSESHHGFSGLETHTNELRSGYAGRYIIMFKHDIDGAAAATGRLLHSLRSRHRVQIGSSVATIAGSSGKSATPVIAVVSVLRPPPSGMAGLRPHSSQSSQTENAANAAAGMLKLRHLAAVGPTTASSSAVASGILQGIVLQLPTDEALLQPLLEATRASPDVQAVIPDREVAAAVDRGTPLDSPTATVSALSSCIEPRFLSQGVSGTVASPAFKWPTCWTPGTQLLWLGRRCGSSRSQIEYTGVVAVNPNTGGVKQSGDGNPCILTAQFARGTWHHQRFGSCGAAPLFAANLPTRVCTPTSSKGSPTCLRAVARDAAKCDHQTASAAEAGSNSSSAEPAGSRSISLQVTLRSPVQCGGEVATQLSYIGTPCGPGGGLIRWTTATTPGGCRLQPSAEDSASQAQQYMKSNQDLYGSCGVPPGNATSDVPTVICTTDAGPDRQGPSPAPFKPPMSPNPGNEPPIATAPEEPPGARVPLAPNEQVPSGVARIGAVNSGGVLNTLGHPVANQAVVGIVDSGVDGTHPDINVVGGKSWALAGAAAEDAAASEDDALTDPFGHGTHVAGIATARNNGNGVIGVSPGSPVYSLRVLDAAGRGSLSNVLSAVNWVMSEGVALGIKVINLSLTAYVDPGSADYQSTFDVVCSLFEQISDAGLITITAAGNFNANMKGYLPATCPSVAAVTAVNADGSAPAAFSNWVPETGPGESKSHVIAAPGTDILSTLSYIRDPSGYKVLSGTSMAAPHVAGVAANCILFGACSTTKSGVEKLKVLQALARKQAGKKIELINGSSQSTQFGFQGDGMGPVDGRYVGFLVWGGWPGHA